MTLNRRLRNLVVEFGLPEADYGLMIGPGVLALLAYPEPRVALVAAPLPPLETGWQLFAADPADDEGLRVQVAAMAAALGHAEAPADTAPVQPAPAEAVPALTNEQLAVVCHPAGQAARVLAGAGTGKTRVIVARFRHLVEQGVSPERILCLTFSRAAAAQMRSEVVRHLHAGATLWISTFHSFCLKVLETELAQPLRLLHESEAQALLAGLAGTWGRKVEEAHAFIGQAKDQLLTPEMVSAYAETRNVERLKWLADLYGRFQAELGAQEAAEFGDFIMRAVQLLESDPAVAARWQARFDHILVDEFQDTNLAQFQVLQILAKPHGNLMVVGDDDQAIYRFRGATDRYMRRFPEYVPGAADYPVVENFRCPAPVLAVANKLIARNSPERVEKELKTLTKLDGFPAVAHWEANTERDEAEVVAAAIERGLKEGRRPTDYAILLRSVHRSGGEFARALRERAIPCRLVGEAYPHSVTAQTRALLRLTQGLTAPDLLTVLAGRTKPDELYAAVQGARGRLVAYLKVGQGPEPVRREFHRLADWLAVNREKPAEELVYEALRYLGHLELSLKPTTTDLERYAAVRHLQEGAAGAPSVDGLLREGGDGPVAPGGAEAVTIMTIHAAKGLQFRHVFVGALAEGLFPVAVDAAPVFYLAEAIRDWADTGELQEPTATQRLAQHIREERRLAYVALTRAEESLVLTRALTYQGNPAQPSRYLAEMGAPAPEAVAGRTGDVVGAARAYLVGAAAGLRRADAARVEAAISVMKAEPASLPLRQQFDPVPFTEGDSLSLSVSAMETYRVCPRKYYYAYVLGLPDEDNVYTAFGSALHLALERFNKIRMGGEFPAWSTLASFWEEAMVRDSFTSDSQHRQLLARGRRFLERYYRWLAVDPPQVVGIEGAFTFPYTDAKGRVHQMRGRYDLIERDRAGNETIIDYKSAKRSNYVNKTLRGDGEKHPQRKLQLGLYYLARHGQKAVAGARVAYVFLRHEGDQMPQGFVEQFEPGEQYIACEHTDQTLQRIRETIDGVIDAILANDFHRNIDDWTCGACPFQDACEVSRRVYY